MADMHTKALRMPFKPVVAKTPYRCDGYDACQYHTGFIGPDGSYCAIDGTDANTGCIGASGGCGDKIMAPYDDPRPAIPWRDE